MAQEETLARGLHLYVNLNERTCNAKQEMFEKAVKQEEVLITGLITDMKNMLKLLEDRLQILKQVDNPRSALKSIRSEASSTIQNIIEATNGGSSTIPIEVLRTIESALELESLPDALLDSAVAQETSTLLLSQKEVVSQMCFHLERNVKEAIEQTNKYKEQEAVFNKCKNLFSTWAQSSTIPDITSDAHKELNETLHAVVGESKVFSHYITSIEDTNTEGPYEDPQLLLDRVIDSHEPKLTHQYLLTYRYFLSPSELLSNLCTRFCFTPREYEKKTKLITKQQDNIIEFMHFWIGNFPTDMHGTQATDFSYFINEIIAIARKSGRALKRAWKIARKQTLKRSLAPEWQEILDTSSLQESRLITFADLHPKHFVEQLTLYEFQKYAAIQPIELVGQNWCPKNGNASAVPNVAEYTAHYCRISSWFIYQILSIPSELDRAHAMSKLIHMMLLAYQCNNFLATFEIYSALQSVPIFRLVNSWKRVPEVHRRILWTFTYFADRGGRLYKSELGQVQPPAIPYLGATLQDISVAEDGNGTFSSSGTRVNFHFKCVKVHRLVDRVLKFRDHEYQFEKDSKLLSQLHKSLMGHQLSLEEMYGLSMKVEEHHNKNLSGIDFPRIPEDQAARELEGFRDIEILQQFDPKVIAKKSTALTGANDFLQVKTDQFLHLLPGKRSPRRTNSYEENLSLPTETLSPNAGIKEILAYMRSSETGIGTHRMIDVENRKMIEYFSPKELTEWFVERLGETHAYRAEELVKKLIDAKALIGVESRDIVVDWRGNPYIKLTYGEESSINCLMPMNLSSGDLNSLVEEKKESELNLEQLASKMKHPQSGLKIKNRKWLLKKFPNCFVGEQAVTWISYHLDIPNREEAVNIGLQMQEAGLIQHVTKEHKFQDKYLFYNFV